MCTSTRWVSTLSDIFSCIHSSIHPFIHPFGHRQTPCQSHFNSTFPTFLYCAITLLLFHTSLIFFHSSLVHIDLMAFLRTIEPNVISPFFYANSSHLLNWTCNSYYYHLISSASEFIFLFFLFFLLFTFSIVALRALTKPFKFDILPRRARPVPRLMGHYLGENGRLIMNGLESK